ncbi:MAG TPA: SsrA-binding protein SmpB [Candidatus Bipolaricaulota bacterium]
MTTIATNRKARHDYHIEEDVEAGIALKGTEVKSLRQGGCSLQDGYVMIEEGEAFLYNVHISPYEAGNRYNVNPMRPRKLLLNKREIARLEGRVREQGYTLIPLSLYFNERNLVKVKVGVARGLAKYDKREKLKKKEQQREMQKALRQ